MMLTDREWLRFVTFALVAGAVLGALYTGTLAVYGRPPLHAMAGATIGSGFIAIVFHVAMRAVLDRWGEPTPDTDHTPTEETT